MNVEEALKKHLEKAENRLNIIKGLINTYLNEASEAKEKGEWIRLGETCGTLINLAQQAVALEGIVQFLENQLEKVDKK